MEEMFIKLLNISINAGWVVLAVIAMRLILYKAPKRLRCFMWLMVGIRLVCPFSIESVLSLLPSAQTINNGILLAQEPAVSSGIPLLNMTVNPVLGEVFATTPADSMNPMQIAGSVAAWVWLAGTLIMLGYAVSSYIRIRRVVATAVKNDGIWLSDRITAPFTFGILRPRIYMPFGTEAADSAILHERMHIRRHDNLIKPVAFALLTVYWFNPLMWLAYVLLCRDIELACDEQVVGSMNIQDRQLYSQALLACSTGHLRIAACPVAFGATGVKQRIKSILNYKKPALWISIAAIILCVAAAVCLLTNPPSKQGSVDSAIAEGFREGTGSFRGGALLGQMAALSYLPPDGSYYDKIDLKMYNLTVSDTTGLILYNEGISSVTIMSRKALIDELNNTPIVWMNMDDSDSAFDAANVVPEYDSQEDMAIYSYYADTDMTELAFQIYWFNGEPCWFAAGDANRIYELEPRSE